MTSAMFCAQIQMPIEHGKVSTICRRCSKRWGDDPQSAERQATPAPWNSIFLPGAGQRSLSQNQRLTLTKPLGCGSRRTHLVGRSQKTRRYHGVVSHPSKFFFHCSRKRKSECPLLWRIRWSRLLDRLSRSKASQP